MIPSLARLAGEGYLRRIEELESISTRGMNENEEIREYYQRRKAWGGVTFPAPCRPMAKNFITAAGRAAPSFVTLLYLYAI